MKFEDGQKHDTSLLELQDGIEESQVFKQDGRMSGHGADEAEAVLEEAAETTELPLLEVVVPATTEEAEETSDVAATAVLADEATESRVVDGERVDVNIDVKVEMVEVV